MEKIDIAALERRLLTLEIGAVQLQQQIGAQGLALSWLMARLCPDEARQFLAGQANELVPSGKFAEEVAQLDALREDLVQWLDQWKSEESRPHS